RGGQHRASLDQLGSAVGRLQSLDAALGEVARGGREERDRLESRDAGDGHHHVQLEQAARLGADQHREVVAVDPRERNSRALRQTLQQWSTLGGVFALIVGVLLQGSEYGWGTVKT